MENKASKDSKGVSHSVLVSIVTPSFNQGRFIEETIVSVLSQEGEFRLEYLIMDGGSTDGSVEIIKKYDRMLKEGKWPVRCGGIEYFWVSEKDRGQTDAINKGFRAAKGEYIAWINSDDTYLPGAIRKAIRYFEENRDVSMVYGEGYHTKENGEIIERYCTEPFDLKRLSELCYICQPAVFMRRSVLDEVGFLDDGLNYCMDYEYWIRVAKKLKIGYIPEYLATSRLYAETKTMSKRFEIHREIIKTVKKYYGRVPLNWVYGYAGSQVERWFAKNTNPSGHLFRFLMRVVFVYRSLQINGEFPGRKARG